jgi:transposase-like protein
MGQSRRFSSEDKLDLVLRSYAAPNIREFSHECGLDRTTLYAWRQELAQAALKSWQDRRLGRPSTAAKETVESLREALSKLSERHRDLELQAREWQVWAEAAKGLVGGSDLASGLSRLLLGGGESS